MGVALDKRLRQYCDEKKNTFMKSENIVAVGERKGKSFVMKFKVITNEHHANMAVCNSLFSWHKKMAHQNVDQVKETLRFQNISFKDQKFCCEDCIIGKMHRLPFPKSDKISERVGKLIHANLSTPMQENSLGGARYFLMMKDDYS